MWVQFCGCFFSLIGVWFPGEPSWPRFLLDFSLGSRKVSWCSGCRGVPVSFQTHTHALRADLPQHSGSPVLALFHPGESPGCPPEGRAGTLRRWQWPAGTLSTWSQDTSCRTVDTAVFPLHFQVPVSEPAHFGEAVRFPESRVVILVCYLAPVISQQALRFGWAFLLHVSDRVRILRFHGCNCVKCTSW